MTIYGQPREPGGVVDHRLWREAQLMLSRHGKADRYGDCVWCRQPYPCEARELAQRAQAVAHETVG